MENNREKEIDEAIEAIHVTLNHLENAESYLSSASNWGLLDMLGGGVFSTMAKRNKMSDAQKALEQAKASVQQLKKELRDVNQYLPLDLQVGQFLYFADYFFDGFVADWMVQSKIHDAQDQVVEAMSQLHELERQLQNRR